MENQPTNQLNFLEITNEEMYLLNVCVEKDFKYYGESYKTGLSIDQIGANLVFCTTNGKNGVAFKRDPQNLSDDLKNRIIGQIFNLPKHTKNTTYRLSVNPDYLEGGVFWEISVKNKTTTEKAVSYGNKPITNSVVDIISSVNQRKVVRKFRIDTALLPKDRKITFELPEDPENPVKITTITDSLHDEFGIECEFVVMPIKTKKPIDETEE